MELWINATTYASLVGCSIRTARRRINRLPSTYRRSIPCAGGYMQLGYLFALPRQAARRGNPNFRQAAYQRKLAMRPRKKKLTTNCPPDIL